jgi:hypothetical protein
LTAVLILGVKVQGLKETRHIIRGEAFKSGKRVVVLWKNLDEPDWDEESRGGLWEECCLARFCCAGSSWVSSGGCDGVNMQVYFCG